MQLQTIFKAGNSNVVAIPSSMVDELGLEVGQKVVVDKIPGEDGVIVTKSNSKVAKKRLAGELQKWLKGVLVEDKEILDELSIR